MKTRQEKIEEIMQNAQDRKPTALLPQTTVVKSLHFTVKNIREEIINSWGIVRYTMVEELVAIPQEELNEWGYPTDAYTFIGCTTERTFLTAEDGSPYTLVEHINMYSKSNNPTQDKRTKADLKEECKVLGLKIGGNKADLIARLDAFYTASDADDLHINDEGELINPAKEGEEE